jgi:hypothetical protein
MYYFNNKGMKIKNQLTKLVFCTLTLFTILIVVSQVFITQVNAAVGINRTINFQGKVVNKTGETNVTNGSYSFTFRFYDAASGGTQLPSGSPWSETKNLTVTNGIFRTALGDTTAIPTTLDFNADNIYLEMVFNGETFTSRIRMTSVPYAFNAEKVSGLTVTNTTGTLTIPNAKTISFADAFSTSGAFPITLTGTASTNVTLPTTGTLATLAGAEVFTNKTLTDSTTLFQDDGDNSKKLALQLSGISASTTRTLTIPNADGTICISGQTCASSGIVGYWSRTGTVLSPSTSGDAITTSGNISTTGSGTGTFAGLLTAEAGLTVSANQNLTLDSGTGTFVQTYTGTGTAATITANSLTSGNILSLTSTSTAAASNTQKGLNISLSGTNGTSGQTTYGAYISNTHAGTTSTNVGLYVTASGGTTANYAALFEGGTVGIGTTQPTGKLQIHTGSDSVTGLIVRANSVTQSNNLLEIQASNTALKAGFNLDGYLGINGSVFGNVATIIRTKATTDNHIRLVGIASQLGDYFQIKDSGGSTDLAKFTATGSLVLSPAASTTGSPSLLTITAPAHTTLSNAEAADVNFNLARTVQFGQSTTLALQRAALIQAPTYASSVATKTITDTATLAISGAPVKGTNVALTNTHGLLISAGAVSTATNSYGLTVNAQTGASNNYSAAFLGGNVGIGLTNPGTTLDVTGTGRFSSTLTASNGLTLTTGALSLTGTSGAVGLTGLTSFSVDGTVGATYSIGAATTTGTITIGGTAQTGLLTLGQSSGTNTIAIGSGTGATTVDIATGATNGKTVDIGTGAVANTITIGNNTGATSVAITSGTGDIVLSTADALTINGSAGLNIDCAANQFIGNLQVIDGISITTGAACENDDTGISDSRLKTNIASKNVSLSDIAQVNVVDYNYRCLESDILGIDLGCEDRTGVIAQEVAELFPELVKTHSSGYYNVREKSLLFYGLSATAQMADLLDGDGAVNFGTVSTGGTVRLNNAGALQNITGLTMTGNAAVVGNVQVLGGAYQINGLTGTTIACANNNIRGTFTGGIATALTCAGLSDASVKENITALDNTILEKIMDVNAVSFNFKCQDPAYASLNLDCSRQTGVIAQELSEIFPELVYKGEDGLMRVNYEGLNIYTLKAVGDLAKKFDFLSTGESDAFSESTPGLKVDTIESFSGGEVSVKLGEHGFVSVRDHNGEILVQFDASGNAGFDGDIKARKIEGLESITAPKVVAENVELEKIQAKSQEVSLNLTADGKFIIADEEGSPAITFDSEGNGTFKGTITADKIKANQIEGLEILTGRITALENSTASESAVLGTETADETATDSATASSELVLSSLSVDGLARLNDVSARQATVSADLRVKGNGLIEGVLNVIDTLMAKNVMVSGVADFFSQVIFRGDVEFRGQPTFNKDTAGTIIVKKDTQEIEVKFEKEYASTPIINVNITLDKIEDEAMQKELEEAILNGNIKYIVTQRTTKGFVIKLNKAIDRDIPFSWTAILVSDKKNISSTSNAESASAEAPADKEGGEKSSSP